MVIEFDLDYCNDVLDSNEPLKSAKNNLSLDGAKKKNYAFGLKVSF